MPSIYVFPGQGSQAVGMGADLHANFATAREVFAEIDDALNQHLYRLMSEGSESELTLTSNAQPAIFAVSLATVRVLEAEHGLFGNGAVALAGHSLGEYSALSAAGAFSIADAAQLLRIRGDAMQRAVPAGEGAMVAVLNLSAEKIAEICTAVASQSGLVCEIANDNIAGQVVISGHAEAIAAAAAQMKAEGAKRTVPLPVSAPFHCALMQPAADAMADALSERSPRAFSAPDVVVYTNVSAAPQNAPEVLRQHLIDQVCGTVRWRETLQALSASTPDETPIQTLELGFGSVLAGMMRRMPKLAATSLNSAEAIRAFTGVAN